MSAWAELQAAGRERDFAFRTGNRIPEIDTTKMKKEALKEALSGKAGVEWAIGYFGKDTPEFQHQLKVYQARIDALQGGAK